MLLYLPLSSFSASVVSVVLQHTRAFGVVGTLVVKSMTVPSRAKLEYMDTKLNSSQMLRNRTRPQDV